MVYFNVDQLAADCRCQVIAPCNGTDHFPDFDIVPAVFPLNVEVLPEVCRPRSNDKLVRRATVADFINRKYAFVCERLPAPANSNTDFDTARRQFYFSVCIIYRDFQCVSLKAAGGKKDGIQILPFSQIAAKDEFMNMKEATRDDLLAMHRVPPQLMGIVPTGSGSFGDVEKAAKVFAINELAPIMQSLKSVNEWVGEEVVRFGEYALLNAFGGK